MRKNIFKVIVAMLALSLVLVACSNNSDTKDDKKSKKEETSKSKDMDKKDDVMMTKDDSSLPADKIMSSNSKTIVEIASGNPDASTLVDLVVKAGLANTLSSEGPFTVFAPTNAAFAKVPKATLDALAANPDALKQVLTYHVAATKALSSDLSDGQVITMVEGSTLTVGIKDGNVTLTTDTGQVVNVTLVNVNASNGVIHLIDTVMIPKDLKL
ncbi:MAG: fasciclin domain-containing protein [Acidimicrobiia bacterium]|nr:fasciclin domain-containing protein [Acidimicrobiia bacterium]